ncbi:MAG: hypothetical protein M3501_01165 [Actinomycetota bacterium]|nr:hypothetical protein [Actinomycetota bacterium]
MAKLDGLSVQYAEQVAANVHDLESATLRRTRLDVAGAEIGQGSRTLHTHADDLERDTGRILNRIKEGVGKDYFSHRAQRRPAGTDLLAVRTEVAALFLVDDVASELETRATKWVQSQLSTFSVDIHNTTGATRDAFRRVQEQTTQPEPVTVDLRDNLSAATRDNDGVELPTFPGHLYADEEGNFPTTLNDWETEIIAAETTRPTFVGWYRNPSRPTPASLRIAYRDDSGDWTSLQVDFLVVSRRDNDTLGVSIIDPHGDHLADARAKLHALAHYAEAHGDHYVRIESISKTDDGLRVLDLKDASVREAVVAFEGARVTALYESEHARAFA